MRKVRNLIGMPVILQRRRLGRVVQAELSDDLTRMNGIWVDCGLRGTRYIPSEQLSIIGEMTVIAESAGRRRRCTGKGIFCRAVATDGRRLGAIVDAEIDEISFLIRALEMSEGFWEDLHRGRRRILHYNAGIGHSEVVAEDPTAEYEMEDDR